MADLLLEIGIEELPARFGLPAMAGMEGLMERLLAEEHVGHGKISALGTPRRLTLICRDMAESQERCSKEILGPSVKAAYDAAKKPTKACQGFAKGQGVAVEGLIVKSTPKGDYVCAVKEEGGAPTREILSELLPRFIAGLSFPKSMRWGNSNERFARPIRWILAILGGEVVPFEYAGIESGAVSRGHRFMAPGSFPVADVENYLRRAKAASVIVDHNQRRQMIEEALTKEAEARGGEVVKDADLLETVTFLVEFPTLCCGAFAEEYLALPAEVLVTSMKSHQKYFPVIDRTGKLMPLFLSVCNTKAEDMSGIRRGNERVLSARLADARFFYKEDTKEPLIAKAAKLDKVVYQEKLGTSAEKVARFSSLAIHISQSLGLGEPEVVARAAMLCKADLVTEMVGEFPDLQGIMGKYYALESGEEAEVAEAVAEHYLPRYAGDALPATPAGIVLSIADKMDTIAGSFGIGAKPTGSEDPYGLRRLTIGIINIIVENGLHLELDQIIAMAAGAITEKVGGDADSITSEINEFFKGRFQAALIAEGYRYDLVDAVLAAGMNDLVDAKARLKALSDFCVREEFEPLAVAFKRVQNILPPDYAGRVDPGLFKEDAERELYRIHEDRETGIAELKSRKDYERVLMALATMRPAVDAFFNRVLVMEKDEGLRNNRLALVAGLALLFAEVADFTKIVTK